MNQNQPGATAVPDVNGSPGAILDAIQQAVIATDLHGDITYWNRFAETLYGWKASEVLGRNIIDVTPTDVSRETALEILDRLVKGETWAGEFWVRDKTGQTFLAHVTNAPITDASGSLVGVLGTSTAAERRHDEQLVLINRELKHHIKNLFAVASAIVAQSLKPGVPLVEMRQRIRGRLHAIAAAQDILGNRASKGAAIRELVDVLVLPFAPTADRLSLSGDALFLSAEDTTPFALILHELATNALKHGAWAADEGKVAIAWDTTPEGRLQFGWTEAVTLRSEEPGEVGFGTTLIQRGLPRGSVNHTLTSSGLTCLIDLPLR